MQTTINNNIKIETSISGQQLNIFRCSIMFLYTKHYIEVILTVMNKTQAKKNNIKMFRKL